MKLDKPDHKTITFYRAICEVLVKTIPPKSHSQHLEDIVLLLMDGLLKGKLYIKFDKDIQSSIEPKASGWPETHRKVLLESKWLESESSPVTLEGNQLSWRRWYSEMNHTIQDLINRYQNNSKKEKNSQQIPSNENLNAEQISAINAIIKHNIVLLSGGPGTGKTSTIIQMIIEVLKVSRHTKIGLSAPTGKATRRLLEALQQSSKSLDTIHKEKLSQIKCRTLHSWLEARPGGFGKNKRSPINLDLLVIDEMSMVDLALMQALLNAVPQNTKLILVGDPNQLPPIGSGAIWEELQKESICRQFGNGAIHLSKVYRNRGDIASLAKVIQQKGLECFWKNLSQLTKSSNVELSISSSDSIPSNALTCIKEQKAKLIHLVQLFNAEISKEINFSYTPQCPSNQITERLFSCLENLMILSPKKQGRWSVNHIHQVLLGKNLEEGIMQWPEGTPVICLKNQPELGLSNGDIGIIIGYKESRRLLFRIFSDDQKLLSRLIHPARLEKVDPAFALTIHKAQGSEANKVILLWPSSVEEISKSTSTKKVQPLGNINEKLIYTAITRAKENLVLNIINA